MSSVTPAIRIFSLRCCNIIPSHFHYDPDTQEKAVYGVIAMRDECYAADRRAPFTMPSVNAVFQDLDQTSFQSRSYPYRNPIIAIVMTSMLWSSDRLHKKVIKLGPQNIALQDLTQRHELRIAMKRLRYALEFLALERGSEIVARLMTEPSSRLLAQLGAANDSFTASRLARDSLTMAMVKFISWPA